MTRRTAERTSISACKQEAEEVERSQLGRRGRSHGEVGLFPKTVEGGCSATVVCGMRVGSGTARAAAERLLKGGVSVGRRVGGGEMELENYRRCITEMKC